MIALIAALTHNRVIGKDNKLIWHIPEDLKNFKKLTSGNTIIMGRKTYASIGRPLPNRVNIVVSRSLPQQEGITVCKTIPEAIATAKQRGKDTFIIGGETIYRQTIALVDRLYLSWVKQEYDGDAYFPEFHENEWNILTKEEYPEFVLMVYERKPTKRSTT
ncbi:dihydrofolate reductase [Candidatus Woesearchaeota archaeon]|nr:dihydrofolate reductase [Candidatus Woesearchaeota archaeon]